MITLGIGPGSTIGQLVLFGLGGSASGTVSTLSAGVIEMELSGRGNGWTVIKDVLVPTGISWHRGLPGTRVLDCVADAGTLYFTLDNSERNFAGVLGLYSPDHANCLSGFDLNIGVRYRIGTNVRFTGTMSDIGPVPGRHGPRRVTCEAVDWMDVAARTPIDNLPVQVEKRGDEVFQTLVDNLTPISQPAAVEKDTSSDTYPYALDRTRDEQTKFRDELYRLCMSGLDRSWLRGDGTLVYESRTRRAVASSDSDTFDDNNGFSAQRNRGSVINRVQSTVHPRLPSTLTVVMFSLKAVTPITPGNPLVILGPWTDPSNPDRRVGAVTLSSVTAVTDYTANSLADGTGSDLTADLSVSVGLSGNATEFTVALNGRVPGFLTKLQQRGKPLYDYGPSVLQWEDTTSIDQFGLANQPIDMPYQDDVNFGLEVAQYVVYTTAVPITQVSGFVRYVNMNDEAEVARSIERDISDRIKIIDTVTGISRSFFINAIDETETEHVLKTQWLLVPADTTAFWLLEVVGRSELDQTTRLGFGLIVGHTDIIHGDAHVDTVHADTPHVDTAHVDNHTDTHTDAAHSDGGHTDTHSDVAHSDVSHSDSHNDHAHSDVAHLDSSHSDSHSDSAHSDSHTDQAFVDNHTDQFFEEDPHNDFHGDISHSDTHVDTAHTDSHNDVAHNDRSHTDSAHSDSHGDTAHTDSAHADVHTDAAHSDSGHVDHTDAAHTDAAHSDTNHTDTAHGDGHADTAHADIN